MGSSRSRPFRTQTLTGPGDVSDVPDVQGEGPPTFLLTDPSQFSAPPATMEVGGVQEAIREGAEARAEGIRDAVQKAQQSRERATNQALLNLAGPQVYKAISGTSGDFGLEDQLRIQREAEKRAQQLEQEAARTIPEIEAKAEQEAARLGAETEFQNEQLQREADRQKAEATRQFTQDYNNLVSTLEELKAERESGGGGGLDMKDRLDAIRRTINNDALASDPVWQQALVDAGVASPQEAQSMFETQARSESKPSLETVRQATNRLSTIEEDLEQGGLSSSEREDVRQEAERLRRQIRNNFRVAAQDLVQDKSTTMQDVFDFNEIINTAERQGLVDQQTIDRARSMVQPIIQNFADQQQGGRTQRAGRPPLDETTLNAIKANYGSN